MLNEIRGRLADIIAPELKTERRRLERLAMFDTLTGVANRAALDLALPTAERDDLTAIVLFDVNNFGKLNKTAGHKYGDVILKEIARTIVEVADLFGSAERVFRFGGDEFVCLCPREFADLLRDRVESKFGVRFHCFVSIVGTVGDTLTAADRTLQIRKNQIKETSIYGAN